MARNSVRSRRARVARRDGCSLIGPLPNRRGRLGVLDSNGVSESESIKFRLDLVLHAAYFVAMARFHSRTVRSRLPEMSVWPSRVNTSDVTRSVWSAHFPRSVAFATSNNEITSSTPMAQQLPSGLRAKADGSV